MAYSETRIVIGGLAHVPVLIFIANFIKGKFGIKTKETKNTVVKGEPVKIILKFFQPSIHLELELYLSYLHLRGLYKIQFQLEFFSCKLL